MVVNCWGVEENFGLLLSSCTNRFIYEGDSLFGFGVISIFEHAHGRSEWLIDTHLKT
jgi:hypothetical protein